MGGWCQEPGAAAERTAKSARKLQAARTAIAGLVRRHPHVYCGSLGGDMKTLLIYGSAAALGALPAFAASCESLASLALPDSTITMARIVAAGQFVPPGAAEGKAKGALVYKGLPEFCRVAATLTPTLDSDIKIEVWLPVQAGTASCNRWATADGPASSAIRRWPKRCARDTRPPRRTRGTPAVAGNSRWAIPKS